MQKSLFLAVKKLIWCLINEKRITFIEDEIEELLDMLGIVSVNAFDEVFEKLSYVWLESNGSTIYLALPKKVVLSEEAINVLRILYTHDRISDKDIALVIFEENAGKLDFGNPLAWYLFKLAESYGVKPDEVVSSYNHETHTEYIYYRYGNTWISLCHSYVNFDRHGNYVGMQKGRIYDFRKPNYFNKNLC